jgi:hypothetical protein
VRSSIPAKRVGLQFIRGAVTLMPMSRQRSPQLKCNPWRRLPARCCRFAGSRWSSQCLGRHVVLEFSLLTARIGTPGPRTPAEVRPSCRCSIRLLPGRTRPATPNWYVPSVRLGHRGGVHMSPQYEGKRSRCRNRGTTTGSMSSWALGRPSALLASCRAGWTRVPPAEVHGSSPTDLRCVRPAEELVLRVI